MDPISSLSVAANAVQFIGFATKLICKSKELARSPDGLLPENEETATVTIRLKELAHGLRGAPGSATTAATSPRLKSICTECQELSDELLSRLRLLKVPDGSVGHGWKSFRQALKSVWSKDQIDGMAARLMALRAEIDTEVLLLMRDNIVLVSTQLGSQLNELVAQTKTLESHLLEIQSSNKGLVENVDSLRQAQEITAERMVKRSSDQGDTIQDRLRDSQRSRQGFLESFQRMNRNQKSTFKKLGRHSLDRSKIFQRLTNDVQEAIARLAKTHDPDILQAIEARRADAWIQQETRRASAKLVQLDGKKRAARVSLDIMESLRFPDILHRYDAISDPHIQTFTWIFEDPRRHDKPWDSFLDWLLRGSGVYWIQGKPASGKSTLMRYIWHHPATVQALREWGSASELVVGAFFFWMHGSEKQRSQAGLFRTLLYGILRDRSHLISRVFPEEWARKSKLAANDMPITPEDWSLGQLQAAFQRLLRLASPQLRFCFFIDGLDEYDGDHGAISEFIRQASNDSPYVKSCVSSRPLPVIQSAFYGVPGLKLQDLTRDDIRRYVQDRLGHHREMQQLLQLDSHAAHLIVEEILEKACGVFLWVTLVVTSLINGLRNGDDLFHLHQRLRALPPDLEELFDTILSQIEPHYRQDSAIIFQLFRSSHNKLGILQLHRALAYQNYRDAVALATDDALTFTTPEFRESVLLLKERMIRRLNSRCRGLLEVGGTHDTSRSEVEEERYGPTRDSNWEMQSYSTLPSIHAPSSGNSRLAVDTTHAVEHNRGSRARRQRRRVPNESRIWNRQPPSRSAEAAANYSTLDGCKQNRSTGSSNLTSENVTLSTAAPNTATPRMPSIEPVTEWSDVPISYLHRTVMDFLARPRVWSKVVDAAPCSDADLQLSLLSSFIVEAKTMPLNSNSIYDSGLDFLRRIKTLSLDPCESFFELITELDLVLTARSQARRRGAQHWSHDSTSIFCPNAPTWARTFLLAALETEFDSMLHAVAACTSQYTMAAKAGLPLPYATERFQGFPVLGYAIFVLFWGTATSRRRLKLIEQLLLAGSDPNEQYKGYSIWEYVILWFHLGSGSRPDELEMFWLPLFILFLQHGADPFASCVDSYSCASDAFFPERATEENATLISEHLATKCGPQARTRRGFDAASWDKRHHHSYFHSVTAVVEHHFRWLAGSSKTQLRDFQMLLKTKKAEWTGKDEKRPRQRRRGRKIAMTRWVE